MLKVDEYILLQSVKKEALKEAYLAKKNNSNNYFFVEKFNKKYMLDEKNRKYIENEINILKRINHPNIIRIENLKMTQNHYYFFTDYCNGGSLKACLDKFIQTYHRPFTEEIVQYIMNQIFIAIQYIHSLEIIHNNLTLGNILVNFLNENDLLNMNLLNSQIKITNFKFAFFVENFGRHFIEQRNYENIDPLTLKELVSGNVQNNDYRLQEKVDIWALGIICYQMLTGNIPFNAYNNQELLQKFEEGTYKIPTNLSRESISFINSMLQYEPRNRQTAKNLLNHPFLKKNVNEFSFLSKNMKNIYDGQLFINIKNNNDINQLLGVNIPSNISNKAADERKGFIKERVNQMNTTTGINLLQKSNPAPVSNLNSTQEMNLNQTKMQNYSDGKFVGYSFLNKFNKKANFEDCRQKNKTEEIFTIKDGQVINCLNIGLNIMKTQPNNQINNYNNNENQQFQNNKAINNKNNCNNKKKKYIQLVEQHINIIEIKKKLINNKPTSNRTTTKNIIKNNNIIKQPIYNTKKIRENNVKEYKNKEIPKMENIKTKDIINYNQTCTNQFYPPKNKKIVRPIMQTRMKPSISDKNILPQKALVHSKSQQNYNITPLNEAIKKENKIMPKKVEKIKRKNIDNNQD